MARLRLVQNDTRPIIYVYLQDNETGLPINLIGATVRMLFREEGTTTTLFTLTGTLLAGSIDDDGDAIDNTVYPTAGSGGRVSFAFTSGMLNVTGGMYEGELKIFFPDATVQTVWDPLKFVVKDSFT